MPTVDINGHSMYYEVHQPGGNPTGSEGTPAIVMGGWGTFCHGGLGAVPWAVTQNHTTVVFDYRGIGESTDDLETTPSTQQYATDVAGLLDHLGWSDVHVVGMVGMGACIGQELAIARPDLVRSLLMTGTWAKADPIFTDQLEGFRRAHAEAGFATFQLLVASFSFTPEIYNEARDRLIGPDGAWKNLQGREVAHSRLVEACLTHDTVDRLDQITCPTMVVHAGQDVITRPEMTRVLEHGIPNAEGFEWPEIAHVIAGRDQRKRFDDLITDFFTRVERAPTT
ncbi:alpha/beta fold hydrolase [Euzebya tangerina]|uniref:alpha/beta fold hydrolase n=1 Tax=Euzebya tangerina TaxID=591198 RepID=UPI000E31760E|nr:alpha/beta hydrolase [Euzebya tangerina]